ncbi:MAG: hypothetical protein A3F18_03015 [Legionellales bacterium RIFCSPHIGHO2_12_FULL_37_14]|nr:MAG: hypothetical protein A3F18_03015 [Legionellales bacterium RIFCSPHIGHO2_12_FULL_37_14]
MIQKIPAAQFNLCQKEKHQAKNSRQVALRWLQTKFPEAFDNQIRIRPLKIGIMQDILEYADKAAKLNISKSKLREAVVLFTRRLDYLVCIKAQEHRIDLFGQKAEKVTPQEAESASNKIKKRIEKANKHTNTKQQATPRQSSMYHEKPMQITSLKSLPAITIKRKFMPATEANIMHKLKEKLDITEGDA